MRASADLPKHVEVPFLSLTISKQPEAGIGTLGLSLTGVAMFCSVLFHYKHFETLARRVR